MTGWAPAQHGNAPRWHGKPTLHMEQQRQSKARRYVAMAQIRDHSKGIAMPCFARPRKGIVPPGTAKAWHSLAWHSKGKA